MKKIIGIIAAVAMVASVFAADVAAKVKLDGNLFKYDADSKGISVLEIHHADAEQWNPALNLSFSDDKAGASFGIYTGVYKKSGYGGTAAESGNWNAGYWFLCNNWQIWFKPIDMIKVIVGDYSTNLNQEMITWSKTKSASDGGQGYGLEINPTDNVGIAVALTPGWGNPWLKKDDGADPVLSNTYLKFQFGADFGTISAMFKGAAAGGKNFKDNVIGVGYRNNFGGTTFFLNALGYLNENIYYENTNKVPEAKMGFEKVRLEAYLGGGSDGLSWALWVPAEVYTTYAIASYKADDGAAKRWLKDKGNDAEKKSVSDTEIQRDIVKVGAIAKVSFAMGSVTPYLYVACDLDDGNNLLDIGKSTVEIKPGVTGSVGAMGWELALDMKITDSKVGVEAPVTFTVNF